jgi:hypothetical protein
MRNEISVRYADVDTYFERNVCSCRFGMRSRRIGWVISFMY